MSRASHWQNIHATKGDDEVSWTQREPRESLQLIRELLPRGRVIDIGGGSSLLVDHLLDAGHEVTVLDIAAAALQRSQQRLGARAAQVRWIVADVLELAGSAAASAAATVSSVPSASPAATAADLGAFDLWHDRAVFHFLTDAADRARYADLARRCVRPGGHLVVAAFALDGPDKCSGLPVRRCDAAMLEADFAGFAPVRSFANTHLTPWGKPQPFIYAAFRRDDSRASGRTVAVAASMPPPHSRSESRPGA
jgi:SAM-dependent methyltransferase